jgi:eukaryotic-like serine/threonine-protein kinase
MRVKCEFGPYTLIRREAVGGMSHVFIAKDHTLNREVAVKILSENYSKDKRRVKAFKEEAKVTASFSHPNVVRVLTTGEAYGRLYIAMEYVSGGHLEKHIKERGQIPEIELLPIAIDVAEGLKAANTTGRLHRDVKPGNILLDHLGNAKIVDFGLALTTHGGKAHASEIWATPYYVSPETIQGSPEDIRSDIYSFGATLYHALAGKVTCGDRMMSSSALVEAKKKITPLRVEMPALSDGICKVVERAIAFDPKDRFSTYDEVIFLLEEALLRLKSQSNIAVETSGSVAKSRARKRLHILGTLTLATLFLTGSSTLAYWWINREVKPKEAKLSAAQQLIPFVPPAQAKTSLGQAYQEARDMLQNRNPNKASAAFDQIGKNPSTPEPTRSWAVVEATIATYLSGDSTTAKEQAKFAATHISAQPESFGIPSRALVQMLENMAQPEILPVDWLDVSNSDASAIMAWMLAGLKNWEQGALVEGVGYFTAVINAKTPDDAVWIELYQRIANDYLIDYKLITNPALARLPADKARCQAALEELEAVFNQLQTQGRAQRDMQALLMSMKKHLEQFPSSN